MTFLLDTDTVVSYLRGHERVVKKIQATPAEALALSAITLRRLESSLAIIDFDAPAAAQFGALRSKLERAGKRLDDLDLLLASTALTRKQTMVTQNSAHFQCVPNLALQDWLKD